MKQKSIDMDELDGRLIAPLLRRRLGEIQVDVNTLLLTKERELTEDERATLPSTLQGMTRGELREQIDPWISLRDHYQYLADDIDPDLWV